MEGYVVTEEPFQPSDTYGYVVTNPKRDAEDDIERPNPVTKQSKKENVTWLTLLRTLELTFLCLQQIEETVLKYLAEQKRKSSYKYKNCSETTFKEDYNTLIAPYLEPGEDFYNLIGYILNVVGMRHVPAIVCRVFEAAVEHDIENVKSIFEHFAFSELEPFFEQHLVPVCKTDEDKNFVEACLKEMTEDHKLHVDSVKDFLQYTCFEEASDNFDDCFSHCSEEDMTKEQLTLYFEKKIFPYCNEPADTAKVQGWLEKFLERK